MKGYVIAIVSALFIPIVLGKLKSYFPEVRALGPYY